MDTINRQGNIPPLIIEKTGIRQRPEEKAQQEENPQNQEKKSKPEPEPSEVENETPKGKRLIDIVV